MSIKVDITRFQNNELVLRFINDGYLYNEVPRSNLVTTVKYMYEFTDDQMESFLDYLISTRIDD